MKIHLLVALLGSNLLIFCASGLYAQGYLKEPYIELMEASLYETNRADLLEVAFRTAFPDVQSSTVAKALSDDVEWAQVTLAENQKKHDSEVIAAGLVLARQREQYSIGDTLTLLENEHDISLDDDAFMFAADVDRFIIRPLPVGSIRSNDFPERFRPAFDASASPEVVEELRSMVQGILSGNERGEFPLYYYLLPLVHQTGETSPIRQAWLEHPQFQMGALYVMTRAEDDQEIDQVAIELFLQMLDDGATKTEMEILGTYALYKTDSRTLQIFLVQLLSDPQHLYQHRAEIARMLSPKVLQEDIRLRRPIEEQIREERRYLSALEEATAPAEN